MRCDDLPLRYSLSYIRLRDVLCPIIYINTYIQLASEAVNGYNIRRTTRPQETDLLLDKK